MTKRNVTEQEASGRVLSHGKITSLSAAFTLASGYPFSLFIIPKDTEETEPVIVSVKLDQDDSASNCPFNLRCWNEPAVIEVGASAINLTNYDVYWGAGIDVNES